MGHQRPHGDLLRSGPARRRHKLVCARRGRSQLLSPSWQFNITTPGENRYVDAGPPDCKPTPTEGPYIGQCPLHLEVSKQPDGSAKIYFIVNSFSSPYLLPPPPTPAKPAQSAPAGVSLVGTR